MVRAIGLAAADHVHWALDRSPAFPDAVATSKPGFYRAWASDLPPASDRILPLRTERIQQPFDVPLVSRVAPKAQLSFQPTDRVEAVDVMVIVHKCRADGRDSGDQRSLALSRGLL